jgi:hypothetical protein
MEKTNKCIISIASYLFLDPVICSTCDITEDCTENNVTSRYQCV